MGTFVRIASITANRTGEQLPPRFSPIDWLTALYGVSAGSILLAHVAGWSRGGIMRWELGCILLGHALLFALVSLAPLARARAHAGRCLAAEWYALVVMSALYASVGLLNHPREVAVASLDLTVQGWEASLFGRQVAFEWSRTMPSAALTWVLGLCYLAFYPLVVMAPGALWATRRDAGARQTIFGIALAFFACYLCFLLFPVAGPSYWWGWPTDPATSVWPARVLRRIIESDDSWGSAFPSSHVAASMTAAVLVLRHWRAAGLGVLAIACGIAAAVVYCQVHYALDALAGLAVAAGASWIAIRLCPPCEGPSVHPCPGHRDLDEQTT